MKLQIALDFLSLQDALKISEEVSDYVDILEVGTPLILKEGLKAVKKVKQRFPKKTILADLKIADAGAQEAAMAYEMGADVVTVLASASDSTIKLAIRSARELKKEIMADLILVKDVYQRSLELQKMGVDYICLHTAFDDQKATKHSFQELAKLKNGLSIQIAVAGGISELSLDKILPANPDIIVVGSALTGASNRGEMARRLKQSMKSYLSSLGKGHLKDLSAISGLDIKLDLGNNHLLFGPGLVSIEPTVKRLQDIRPVLLNPEIQEPKEIYYIYRSVCCEEDRKLLEKHNLRFDLVVIPPGKIGQEYVKTTGHSHEVILDSFRTYPEIYFVLSGTAHYIFQKVSRVDEQMTKPEVEDVYCVIAKPGDIVFIPSHYEHLTINTSKETLVVGNWVGTNFKSVYEGLKKSKGACYYLIEKEGKIKTLPNPNYRLEGEILFCQPEYHLSIGFIKGKPIYPMVIDSLERFAYLRGEGNCHEIFSRWNRIHSFNKAKDKDIKKLVEIVLSEVKKVSEALVSEQYASFIKFLLGAERIFITGQGRSGLVAKAFAMRLMHLNFKIYVVGEVTTPCIGEGDLLIACSGSGTTPTTLLLAESARNAGTTVIAITCGTDSPLSEIANLAIQLPAVEKNTQTKKKKTVQLPGTLFEQALFLYFDASIMTLRKILKESDKEMMNRHANLE
jgi:3-hexulose-6-phosphate synthase